MKYLKLMVIAMVMVFAFGSARAQVVVKARIGTPVHRVYHRHRRAAVVVVSTGPYFWHGRHYSHRAPYWRNHHRYYRYY